MPAPAKAESARDGTRLTWALGTLPAGALPKLFDLDLQASSDVKQGTELLVDASLATSDKVVDQTSTRTAFVLSVMDEAADLIVESSLDGTAFTADNPVDFTVEVTNLGTAPASDCSLKMTTPSRVTSNWSDPLFSEHTANVFAWKLGNLAPMESRTVEVKVIIDSVLRMAAYGFAPQLGRLHFTFDASTGLPLIFLTPRLGGMMQSEVSYGKANLQPGVQA